MYTYSFGDQEKKSFKNYMAYIYEKNKQTLFVYLLNHFEVLCFVF